MSLLSCADCHQPVSSEAHACPGCGRPTRIRNYLTPMAQVVVGGLVLAACLAWPPSFLIVGSLLIGRLIGQASRAGALGTLAAAGVILTLTITLMYAFSQFAFILMVVGIAATGWLVVARFRVARSTA